MQILKNNQYQKLKIEIRTLIKDLPSYSTGEENLIIEETLCKTKTQLILQNILTSKEIKKIEKVVKKRIKNEPLSKILKRAYFYQDEFYINNFVLSPRKETEILVEQALKEIDKTSKGTIKVLDLCCGSGAIGLSVAKHSKNNVLITLSDISIKALKVTKINQKKLNVKNNTIIKKSNMFRGLNSKDKFDIILSNPPYIKSKDILSLDNSVISFDPIISLDGGIDGLDFYKIIANNSKQFLSSNGIVIVEIGYNQGQEVQKIFKKNNFSTSLLKDYSQNDRVIIAKPI